MAAIDFPHLLLLIILFTVALTSSVNAKPDGTSVSPDPNNGSSSKPFSPEVEHHCSDDKNGSKNLTNTSINTEGGLISIPTQHLNIENTTVTRSDEFDGSRTRENMPKERNASPSVVGRKGVEDQEKIKPRKGVKQDPERTDTSLYLNQTNFRNIKPITEADSGSVPIDNQFETSNITMSKLNITMLQSEDSSHHINSTNLTTINILPKGIVYNATKPEASSHIAKHIPKPKPTITSINGPEVDDYKPSSHTKSYPLGMPRKIDYIVPVITTIFALPLLGTAIFILYRRGRDCWDKRHYRRMDFLIDGMYND